MKALIMCNGKPPSQSLLQAVADSCDIFIGADGGGHVLLNAGIKPDYITGDMDSFDASAYHDITVKADTDQETNDLEKALRLAIELNIKNVQVLGATGLRLDHTLKNLSVLQRYESAFSDILISDDHLDIRILPEEFEMPAKTGTPVSLFPLSGRVEGITTEGLKYSLSNEFLENGIRDGSSNETTGEEIRITHTTGTLLMLVSRT